MTTAYWYGNYSDLNDKRGVDHYDKNGIHKCCREYRKGPPRHAPVASLGLGPPTKAILKCDVGIDLSIHYPSFVEKTLSEIHTIIESGTNHFYHALSI